MKEGGSAKRNDNVDNLESRGESSAATENRDPVSSRIQNPLIPPGEGCSEWPGWWRLVGSSPESRGFSVAGDLNSFSAKLTAMLVPILLIVLVLVLIADYSNVFDSGRGDSPVAADFVAEEPLGMEEDALDAALKESAAVPAREVSEVSSETANPVEVVTEDVAPKDAGSEIALAEAPPMEEEAIPSIASEAAIETNDKPKEATVEGILYSRDNPSAIIGGRIVHVGDIVSDALVVEIQKDRVLFEKTGQKWDRGVQEAIATP